MTDPEGIKSTVSGNATLLATLTQLALLFLKLTRAVNTPAGLLNIPEFGPVKTKDGFDALYAMSSYHHVKDGVAYPAVLLTTGLNDPRGPGWGRWVTGVPTAMAASFDAMSVNNHEFSPCPPLIEGPFATPCANAAKVFRSQL